MRVLIVEDDAAIASFLSKGLKAEGYPSEVASTYADGLHQVRMNLLDFDLVLLDLMLPDGKGLDLLTAIKEANAGMPVILLTAMDRVGDKVAGLDAGASDYITKPFHFDELLARVRACVRSRDQHIATELTVGDVRLDLLAKTAWRGDRRISLSPRELSLLEIFLRNPEQVISRARLLSRVWDYDFDPGTNVVEVYVGYLRRKLNLPDLPRLIETVRGVGYRFIPLD